MSVDWSKVEWRTQTRGPAMVGPTVAVNKSGKIVLNHEALTLIGQPEAVQVGIIQGSRGKVTLVMQAAAREDTGSLVIGKQGKRYTINTTKWLRDRGLEDRFGKVEANPEVDHERDALLISI